MVSNLHKNIAILGKSEHMVSERAHEYFKQSESLIIGDIEHGFSLNDLNVLQGMVDDSTRIDIFAHGGILDGNHVIRGDYLLFTKDLLQILRSYNESSKLLIHLWSCYGGTASKDATVLAKGSVLITHALDDHQMIGELANFAFKPPFPIDNYFAAFASEFWSYSLQTSKFTVSIGDGQISSFCVAPKLSDLFIDAQQVILQVQSDFTSFAKQHDAEILFRELSNQEIIDFTLGYFIYLCNVGSIDINEVLESKNEASNKKLLSIINTSIDGLSPLIVAIKAGQAKLVVALLEGGAEVNSIYNTTPLIKAVVHQHEDIVRILLQKGADVNFSDSNSFTPLLAAAFLGHVQIGKMLLENGANPNLMGANNTIPIKVAYLEDNFDFVEMLRAFNIKGQSADFYLVTDLIIAVRQGNVSMIKQLMDVGVIDLLDESCNPLNFSNFENFIGDFCPSEGHEEEYITHVCEQYYFTVKHEVESTTLLPSFYLH